MLPRHGIKAGTDIREKIASTRKKLGIETETSIGKEQKELVGKEGDVMTKSQHIETLFRKIASDIKDPLRKKLKKMTQLQEGVANMSLESFPKESTEQTLGKTTELQKEDGGKME